MSMKDIILWLHLQLISKIILALVYWPWYSENSV